MHQTGRLAQLMLALRCLPGVGQKSAQRTALHLLLRNRQGARALADAIYAALEHVGHCRECRTLTEGDLCDICANPGRDAGQLCVVENPNEIFAIEHSTGFKGKFFVLNGRLSPLDGIGPGELGLSLLEEKLRSGSVQELILATNTTVEGEATAHYLGEMAQHFRVRATRIAYGVPLGGELEYIDGATIAHAFKGRQDL